MRKNLVLLSAFLVFVPTTSAFADIAAIHASSLPQETAVLAALDDVSKLEPYTNAWAIKWKLPIAKDEVARRLEKDLGLLNLALKTHPDNIELLLLTGLTARYAYNVDVPNAHDMAISALAQAQKLAPADFRAPWFHASLLCQTVQTKPGADEFLSIESSHTFDQLPRSFWDDYIACATITNMPAHVLRAASYIEKLHATESEFESSLVDIAQKRFDAYDPNKQYEPKDVWQGVSAGSETEFTSTLCGTRLETHGDWSVNQIGFSNGSCVAYFGTGPYKATTRDLRPSILLLVHQAADGESLQDFFQRFVKGAPPEAFTPTRCPSASCIAVKLVQNGMYKADGDGHGRIVVFERDQPEFPGLIFESPLEVPSQGAARGPQVYRPKQTQQRIPGKLYYLVLLDVAASIEDPAMKDLDFFLLNLTVE